MTLELWTAKDLLDYATFSKMQAGRGKFAGEEALIKALKDADADGLPLKCITTTPEGTKVTMEVVKAEKKSLLASTFEIPAGYTNSTSVLDTKSDMASRKAERAKKQRDQLLQRMQ